MNINVGQLELLISALGADATIADIHRVDAAAAAAGAKPHTIAVDAKGAAVATAEVTAAASTATAALGRTSAGATASYKAVATAMKAEVAAVAVVAKESAAAVDTSLRASVVRANSTRTLMQRLASATGLPGASRAAGVVGAVDRSAEGALLGGGGAASLLGGLGITLGAAGLFMGVKSAVTGAIEAVTTFNVSLRVLESTAKLTGVPLATLTRTSAELQKALGLTATQSNTLTAAAVRFTAQAGRANETGTFLTRWLDLAKARGLDATAAMQALNTTIDGQDEGLNRLGLMNPSGIWAKWAASMDTTTAKMTDQQKAQAIFNEVVEKGALVQGAFAAAMDTAEGAVIRLKNAKENFLVSLGQAITGTKDYNGLLGTFTGLVDHATGWVTTHGASIRSMVGDLATLAHTIGTVVTAFENYGRMLTIVDATLQTTAMVMRGVDPRSAEFRNAAKRGADAWEGIKNPNGKDDLSAFDTDPTLAKQFATRAPIMITAPLNHPPTPAEIAAEKRAAKARVAAAHAALEEAIREQAPALQAAESAMKARVNPIGITIPDRDMIARKQLADAAKVIDDEVKKHPIKAQLKFGVSVGVIELNDISKARKAAKERVGEMFKNLGMEIGQTFAHGITVGLTTAFETGSVRKGLAAMGQSILQGLGSTFSSLGEALLAYGAIMTGLVPLFGNPITSGPAALAAGAALVVLGAAFSAISSGHKKGDSGGSGRSFSAPISGDTTTRTVLGPRAAPVNGQMAPTGRTGTPTTVTPIVVNAQILSPSDPTWQRKLSESVQQGVRRGMKFA